MHGLRIMTVVCSVCPSSAQHASCQWVPGRSPCSTRHEEQGDQGQGERGASGPHCCRCTHLHKQVASFIFGNNTSVDNPSTKESVAMTSPVRLEMQVGDFLCMQKSQRQGP